MTELNIRFDLRLSSRVCRMMMASAMFLTAVGETASESVTMTTYYPAPSGVYTQLITTSNTWLARDSGSLAVGTTTGLGAGVKMAVMGGSMGIGTTTPVGTLDVQSATDGEVPILSLSNSVNENSFDIGTNMPSGGGAYNYIQSNTNVSLGVASGSPGWLDLNPGGNYVGIHTTSPGSDLDVNGSEIIEQDSTVLGHSTLGRLDVSGQTTFGGPLLNSEGGAGAPAFVLGLVIDDCDNSKTYNCPAGYSEIGRWHINNMYSVPCSYPGSPVFYGPAGALGHIVQTESGWVALCGPQ